MRASPSWTPIWPASRAKRGGIGGALMVNSTLGADVTVKNGGTLGGSGAILGDVVALAGATVLPGNSPGVLTINGDFTLDPGALLQNGNH